MITRGTPAAVVPIAPILVTTTRRLPSPAPGNRVVVVTLPVTGSVTAIGVPGCVPVPAAPYPTMVATCPTSFVGSVKSDGTAMRTGVSAVMGCATVTSAIS